MSTMDRKAQAINDLVDKTVAGMGYELLGTECVSGGKAAVVRFYIDSEKGITADDCQKVSKQISAVLDVENPVAQQYRLEISSPGLDRPLFSLAQMEKCIGKELKLRLKQVVNAKRNVTGVLKAISGEEILLQTESEEVRIAYTNIKRANLVPEL